MDLSKQFNPIPKPQREKPKPKFKNKRHKTTRKKQKKVERYKGVTIPSRKDRAAIDKTNYKIAFENYNGQCGECGSTYNLEMHHIIFRSQSGRKGWRNLVPLCKEHHSLCHTSRDYAEKWREIHYYKYGKFYYMDKWDLWKMGVIPNGTDESFEKYMKGEGNETLRD